MMTIANFCILVPTWSKDASIWIDSIAAPEVPASNLLKTQPSMFYRSKQCECIRIIASRSHPIPWNAVYLGYTNSSTATICITSDDTLMHLFGIPDFDSGPQQMSNSHFFLTADRIQESKYIGIEIRDKNNPDGFFQAGIFQAGMMAEIKEPPIIDDRTSPYEPEYAHMGMVVRPRRRVPTFDLKFMTYRDIHTIESLMRKYECRMPMVFKWDRLWNDERRQMTVYSYARWRRFPDQIRIEQL